MEEELLSLLDVVFPEVNFLETVGGVRGGVSNLGDELEDNFSLYSFFLAAALPSVVLSK